MKSFDGEPKNWQFFVDSFNCAIDSNESLSGVQKLTYLKNLVTGKAASIIDGIPLSNNNYETAFNLLKDRYDNKQLQISSHMKSLLEISDIYNVNNIDSLRTMYDNIETQIRHLKHLGIEADMYGPMLVPIIMSKIPQEINLIISRQLQDKDCWQIDDVLRIFKSELTAREKTNAISNVEVKDISQRMSASSLFTNSSTNNNKGIRNYSSNVCVFCEKSHKSLDCRIVTSVERRRDIAREKKLCFVCLRAGHIAKNCRSNIRCYKCDKRHHTAVCKPIEQKNFQEPPVNEATTNFVSNKTPSGILLQTATASVTNPNHPQITNRPIII